MVVLPSLPYIAAISLLPVQHDVSLSQWHESGRINFLIKKSYATIQGLSSIIFTTPLSVWGPLCMPNILLLHLASIQLNQSLVFGTDSARADYALQSRLCCLISGACWLNDSRLGCFSNMQTSCQIYSVWLTCRVATQNHVVQIPKFRFLWDFSQKLRRQQTWKYLHRMKTEPWCAEPSASTLCPFHSVASWMQCSEFELKLNVQRRLLGSKPPPPLVWDAWNSNTQRQGGLCLPPHHTLFFRHLSVGE